MLLQHVLACEFVVLQHCCSTTSLKPHTEVASKVLFDHRANSGQAAFDVPPPTEAADLPALRKCYVSGLNKIIRTSRLFVKQIELLDAKQANWNRLKRRVE